MDLEMSEADRDLLTKIVQSYLSDLRQTIAATKRGTADLHAEEDRINELLVRLSRPR